MKHNSRGAKAVYSPKIESREPGLAGLLLRQVENSPDRPSVISAERTLSYAQLAEQAKGLAAYLCRSGVQYEQPVAILLGAGIEQVICQAAILLAGGTCVPLNPALPDERLNFMLQEVGAVVTLTDRVGSQRPLTTRFITLPVEPEAQIGDAALPGETAGPAHRSHILFTSGTTGRPKGVEIEARGIVRMVRDSKYLHITAADRLACIANPAFDAALLEVWGALVNGASLVVIPKDILLNPQSLESALQRYGISFMLMTTSLFNFMAPQCPNAFRSLEYLLIGGEAFNPEALKSIPLSAWPRKILNSYGPTEGTTITLFYPIDAADLNASHIPIGWPVDNTAVFILDDKLQPVAAGDPGELFIGGDGLARGYANRPELTREKFLTVPIAGEELPERLYKSGDVVWQRPDGAIMYAGRSDTQIKIQGYRIEVEEIELQLLNSGLLLAAIVCLVKKEGVESYLQAFIVPRHPESFDNQALHAWIKQRLPPYMLPRLQVIESIPLNENGKADRALLLSRVDSPAFTRREPANTSEETSGLLQIWGQVLDIHPASLDDDFFLLGGTSLQAARLVLEIKRRFGRLLSIQDLYDARTPRNLLIGLHGPQAIAGAITEILISDSRLPEDIQPLPQAPRPWRGASAGGVLLTGATGFAGAFVLRDLLSQGDIRQITCLARAADNDQALERIAANLTRYGLWRPEYAPKIRALAGDVAQARLGLDSRTYRQVATECDVIFHLAAHISFIEPYASHREANVTGAINVLRLAVDTNPKGLHYVSTIAAIGPAGLLFPVSRFYEDDDLGPYLEGMNYTLGYIQSKWVAERLMSQARQRGVPLSIYRPGFMITDSVTGAGNPEDFMWRVIKGCIRIGYYPVLPGDRKELVTVDYASAALLSLASDNKRLGRNYHLVPPTDRLSISLTEFFELFKACGYDLAALPYKHWLQRLYDDPDLDGNPLMPLLPMLSEVVYGDLTVWEAFKNIPRYDAGKTQTALAEAHAPAFIAADAPLLARYLAFMQKTGQKTGDV